nr:Immunoglobulin domain containing protein [Hymenolepis microstoma]
MKVVCKSASVPYPDEILWFRVDGSGDQMTLTSAENIETTHIKGDTLVFPEVKMSDTGSYVCNTTNRGGLFDSSVAEVKIKSRFAALWPFIGILAELIILMITIIVYERHKAAKKKAISQNDSALSTSVSPSGDVKSHQGVRA